VNQIAPKNILTYGYFIAGHSFAADSDLLDDRCLAA
jgi:hypothetical protein